MAVICIFVALCVACLLLFFYPYLIYPQLLRLFPEKPLRKASANYSVSLLFCAYNEVEALPGKIANLRSLKQRSPELAILVYDDASSDGTFELLAQARDILTLVRGPGRTGKAAGMKELVRRADTDVLIFTDANILLSMDVIDRLLPYYADCSVGGVACTIQTETDAASLTSQVGSSYIDLDDKLQELESRTGNVMGASGGLFSVRRQLYPEFPDTVQDDFTVSMSVIFRGKRLVKALDVIGYERTVSERSDEVRRKMRIGARAYHTHSFMRPSLRRMSALDRFKYVSRKMLRWFGGFFLAMGGIFGLGAIATVSKLAAAIFALLGLIAVIVGLKSEGGLLARGSELAIAIFATLFGVLQGMRGQTMATWSPAKSR